MRRPTVSEMKKKEAQGAFSKLVEFYADRPQGQIAVLEEAAELEKRGDKLSAFLDTEEFKGLDPEVQGLMKLQLSVMAKYLNVLADRIKLFWKEVAGE